MIKIVILGCFVAWMFIRSLSKAKPNAIWRIKLKRFTFFVMLTAIAWLVTISFGPAKYQVYTDEIVPYQGSKVTLFAWEENRILPFRRFAKPVLLSLDFETIYTPDSSKFGRLIGQYPYDRYHIGIRQFLGSFLFFLIGFVYFSRHRQIDKRWQEALDADSKDTYRLFIGWATRNSVRKSHTFKLRKEALIAIRSIDARGKLKLEMFRKGWSGQGLQSQFLDILNKVVTSGHNEVVVSAKHATMSPELKESCSEDQYIRLWSGLNPEKFMHLYHELSVEEAHKRTEKSDFDKYILNCPEHFRFTYPSHEVMNHSLEKTLASVFNQGKKRFLGGDILEFTTASDSFADHATVKLEMTYNCLLRINKGQRQASVWAGELKHHEVKMDGKSYTGGNTMWSVFGLQIHWKLTIDGQQVSEGMNQTFPDANVCNLSRPRKADLPAKEDVERHMFDVVGLSNVSSLFSQMMGLPLDKINQHVIKLDQSTALEVKRQQASSNQLSEMLEGSLREEALEELLVASAAELYAQNKDMVDAVIRDYMNTYGDTDTVLMIIDLLGEAAPDLAAGLYDIIGGSDE